MIESLEVKDLNGIKNKNVKVKFNSDLTILSGKNGSGKTTLLKLLWYMVSPNVERAFDEIRFREARLITSDFWRLRVSGSTVPMKR